MDAFLLPASEAGERLSCLWQMRENEELCDVSLQLDATEKSFTAHKCVLAASSSYFKAMFTNDLVERSQGRVTISGVDYDTMEAVICYAYSTETAVPKERVVELMIAADLFQMSSLLQHCCNFLKKQLTSQNVLTIRAYAHLHRCWDLYRSCNEYVIMNFNLVTKTEEFLQLPSHNLEDIISSDCLRITSEEEVYSAVIRWVYHDLNSRKEHFPSLMQHIRLPFVSQRFLDTEVQGEKLMLECQQYISEAVYYKTSPEKRTELKDSARTQPRKMFSLRDMMVVAGGTSKDGSTLSVDQYDGRTDSWSSLTSLPSPRYGAAACFYNGNIYVTGGSNDTVKFVKQMSLYSLREKKWSKAAELPIAKRYHAIVAVFGVLNIIGGQTNNGVTASVEQYNTTSGTWSTGSPIQTPRMYHGAVELNGCTYVIGGHSGIERLASVECYRLGQWSYVTPLPEPRSVLGVAAAMGSIYVAGGFNGKEHINTVNYYNPKTNTWTACPSMNTRRSAFGLAVYSNSLYACGGFTGGLTNSVECFTPGDCEWRFCMSMISKRIHFSAMTI